MYIKLFKSIINKNALPWIDDKLITYTYTYNLAQFHAIVCVCVCIGAGFSLVWHICIQELIQFSCHIVCPLR